MLFSKPTFLSASVLGAATVAMVTVAPVQAASITGVVNIVGSADLDRFNVAPLTDTVEFLDETVISPSTGTFAAYIGNSVAISDVAIAAILSTPLDTTDYTGTATNPFIDFGGGLTFEIDNPLSVIRNRSSAGVVIVSFPEFTGKFKQSGEVVGSGFFSVNQMRGEDGSFSMTVQAVPEPLTMLGAGAAAAFGAGFKRKLAQKNKKSEAKS